MSIDKRVFVSRDAGVLAAWHEIAEASKQREQRIRDWQESTGRNLWVSTTVGRPSRAMGISMLPSDEEAPPEGWTKLAKNDFLTPVRRGRKAVVANGVEAEKFLRSMDGVDAFAKLKPFGLPAMEFVGMSMISPGIEFYDDSIWVIWSAKSTWEGNEYFKPAKVSEYYAIKERAEAEEATKESAK